MQKLWPFSRGQKHAMTTVWTFYNFLWFSW